MKQKEKQEQLKAVRNESSVQRHHSDGERDKKKLLQFHNPIFSYLCVNIPLMHFISACITS